MTTFDYNPTAITQLLNKLTDAQDNIFWSIRSCYSNGQEQTILEVAICEHACRKIRGLIAFSTETGQTVNIRYPGYKKWGNENIIDILLDLINLERSKMPEAS